MRAYRARALLGWLFACFLVAVVSTFFTTPAIPTWYASLAKPSFNPPNQVFGPVWTALYALMACAAWMIWKTPSSPRRTRGLALFWLQLALNFLWSWIFFHQHSIAGAFGELLLLWIAILLTMLTFFPIRRLAGWFLLPYLCWVSFASLLNFAILQRN